MMDSTRAWWKDAAERLIWTFIQGALGVPLGAEMYEIITDTTIAVPTLFLMLSGGIAASLSFLKSIAGTRLGKGGTAQMGFETYSYTEQGPGSAGPDVGDVDESPAQPEAQPEAQGNAVGFVEPEYTDDR